MITCPSDENYEYGDFPYVCFKCDCIFRTEKKLNVHFDNSCGDPFLVKRVENILKSHENLSLYILKSMNKLLKFVENVDFKTKDKEEVVNVMKSLCFLNGESSNMHLKIRFLVNFLKKSILPKTEKEIQKDENLKDISNETVVYTSIESLPTISNATTQDSLVIFEDEKKNVTDILQEISGNAQVSGDVVIKKEVMESTMMKEIKNDSSLDFGDNESEMKESQNTIELPHEPVCESNPTYINESLILHDPRISDEKIDLSIAPILKELIPKIVTLPPGTKLPKMSKRYKKRPPPEIQYAKKLQSLFEHVEKRKRIDENNKLLEQRKSIEARTCKYCGKVLMDYRNCQMHEEHIHLNKFTYYFCTECGQKLKSKGHLRAHMKYVHGNARKKFKCQICNKFFHRDSILQKHIQSVHTDNFRTPCEICGKIFKTPSTLRAHVRLYHDKKKFDCRYCEKTFRLGSSRYYHERRDHLNIIDFQCEKCHINFLAPKFYRDHMLKKHGETVVTERKIRAEYL